MKHIRTSKFSKILASYLAIQLLIMTVQPSYLFALTSGPSQPEFNSFTPIGTSDMVNLSSGDFNYNIPIMDVGGYPLNLAYNSGITMDQEASWVGLGWNLNVGQIARNVRGLPDDFKGDEMIYENDMKDVVTIGTSFNITPSIFGADNESPAGNDALQQNFGLAVEYNNYNGYTFRPSYGVSYALNDTNATLGLNISSATGEGASVSPSISLTARTKKNKDNIVNNITGNFGLSLNSRQGVSNLNLSVANKRTMEFDLGKFGDLILNTDDNGSGGGAISFNNNHNFTPTKNVAKNNTSYTFNTSGGFTFFGLQAQGQVTGYGSYQKILNAEKRRTVPAFGYENTQANEGLNGILDFTREKDNTLNKFSTVLPVTNYTYDIYAIQGQGTGGTFRPFRSQMSYVYDNTVSDVGFGGTFGAEFGVGNNTYIGGEIKLTTTKNRTGKWKNKNYARTKFIEKETDDNPLAYEASYFKIMGELDVDKEVNIYTDQIHGDSPIQLDVKGSRVNKYLSPTFKVKTKGVNGVVSYPSTVINSKIKRTERDLRNQGIQKITKNDAKFDPFVNPHASAKGHHTVGVKSIKADGSRYIFGEAAYNTKKVEATFDVSGQINTVDCSAGLIGYNGTVTGNSSTNSNRFLNRVTTPAYAHTYLLSAILSSDYEDITQDGPTDDDLGAYTKFNYDNSNYNVESYQWRIPFKNKMVTHNEGLKSLTQDETGNYIYGKKELKYISTIETKTHIAVFNLSDREDAIGVTSEAGGADNSKRMKKIDKIYLYSKPEYKKLIETTAFDALDDRTKEKAAIKIAHFKYNYNLCGNMPNNTGDDSVIEDNSKKGKLTLEKLYFTYRGSYMGKYTPYIFNYDLNNNPDYNIKGFDIWGCYKENSASGNNCDVNSPITNSEFPFVEQDKALADINTRAWTLSSIDLPSGGQLELETEADDYQYVQDRETMRMFMVSGAGNHLNPTQFNEVNNNTLYEGNDHHEFIYMKLPITNTLGEAIDYTNYTGTDFVNDYLREQIGEPIYFRFLVNMLENNIQKSDYVSGYFEIDGAVAVNKIAGEHYASIPLRTLDKDGGFVTNNNQVNPIAKAGWHFGRTYMNNLVYKGVEFSSIGGFEDAVEDILESVGSIQEIFIGPNQKLQQRGCAKTFFPNKSWIRLKEPNRVKIGGGLRVKRIKLNDNWDTMTGNTTENNIYKQQYGQEYNYNSENGQSSGVATYEPNGSKENPFVEPFFSENAVSYRDRLASPNESNYVEKPLGESFFPSATVTYGRVTVKNLPREKGSGQNTQYVDKHATGQVVNEFYTSKNFPTIADYTKISDDGFYKTPDIFGLFNLSVKNKLTLSQGFVVVTNNMNGMLKRQRVYGEKQDDHISGVDYIYNLDDNNPKRLDNKFKTIDKSGNISENIIGQTYDIVNDFRENYSSTTVGGVNYNVTTFLAAIIPAIIPLPLPTYAKHENILRTAVTTKVIHKTGVLKEKIAYDLGSRVSTKNVAWDAHTGQVLLTQTINEYDDNYYNLTYPAHWVYNGMDKASINLGLKASLIHSGNEDGFYNIAKITDNNVSPILETGITPLLTLGDEIYLYTDSDTTFKNVLQKLWIAEINEANNQVLFMDKGGNIFNNCGKDPNTIYNFKIVRSGYRNQQLASMASVTSMKYPIELNGNLEQLIDFETQDAINNINSAKIINASAVEYKDYWRPQFENGIPGFIGEQYVTNGNFDLKTLRENPFLYNIKSEWRANTSWAYLTGRKALEDGITLKDEGFFKNYKPFYKFQNNTWEMQTVGWTYASEVSKYSPYGAELENRDALNRYSSAQYGYNYTLPTAVASNSEYREMGYDGFEDYKYIDQITANTENGEESVEYNGHFSFYDAVPTQQLVNTESHTGKYSVSVDLSTPLLLKNYLAECEVIPIQNTCEGVDITPVGPGNQCLPTRSLNVSIPSDGKNYVYKFEYLAGNESCWFGSPIYKVDGNVVGASGTISGGNYTFTLAIPNQVPSGYDPNASNPPNVDPVNYGHTSMLLPPTDSKHISASLQIYPAGTTNEDLALPYPFGCFNDEGGSGAAPTSNTYNCGDFVPVSGPDPVITEPEYGNSGYSPAICSSFRPKANEKKYVVSAWVKDVKTTPETESISMVKVYFEDVEPESPDPDEISPVDGNANQFIFRVRGQVIDGWQLITGIVTVPTDATQFNIKLGLEKPKGNISQDHTSSYFDDVRVVPFNGNMKSFVYDEVTQRLMAELDENNYATFYEYDIEGGLVRVKKETEKGVFTIQETRSGNSK